MIETKAVTPSARGAGSRSNFSISGKLTSTTARPLTAQLREHVGQAVHRLRAEHEIDERRALGDALAFLARHAAAHADDHVRARGLQVAPAAELREHLLLRLLAHRAGVEQQQVGLFRIRRWARSRRDSRSTSAIRAESYSFIWQPKVLRCTRGMGRQVYGTLQPRRSVGGGRKAKKSRKNDALPGAPVRAGQARPAASAAGPGWRERFRAAIPRTGCRRRTAIRPDPAPVRGHHRQRWQAPDGLHRATRRRPCRTATAARAAAEHLHLVGVDLGRVAVAAFLVLPLARAQLALDVDLRALSSGTRPRSRRGGRT